MGGVCSYYQTTYIKEKLWLPPSLYRSSTLLFFFFCIYVSVHVFFTRSHRLDTALLCILAIQKPSFCYGGGSPPLALHLEWVLQNIPFCPSCIWRSWVTEDDGVLCCAAVALVCEIAIISLCGEKNGRGDRDIDAIYFCNGLSESATHLQNKDRCFNWPMARRLFFFILFLAMMATLLRSDLSSGFLHFAYPRRFNSCFVSFSIEGERIYGWEREKKLTLWIVNRRTTDSAIGGLWTHTERSGRGR